MNFLNNFLGKAFIKGQMKKAGVPEGQQEQLMQMVLDNPELFQKIAQEVEAKTKEGKDQQTAMMEVMMAHREELQKALKQ